MSEIPQSMREPEAGPSTAPTTREPSPNRDSSLRPLRRPASHGRLSKLMLPGRSRSGSSASRVESVVTAFADEGGPSSGRVTPEQRWRSSRAATTSLLANDAKYKKFAAQVDKCLQAFESVNEWADFISFLSRLLKTLQGPSPSYTEIPRKLVVAKRLAQCLNPALPSGVHQRALDVYAHIFATIGLDGLRRDMSIWSSGIFPFFQFAATSVRPILLKIYETYYIPLGEDLRPVTKALILALLPGMEEETGDFFDKVLSILNQVSEAISPEFFLQNVFLIMVSSPASRLAATNYLARKLLRSSMPDQGLDVGLVVRGVAAVLEDENTLVRRGGLDLLLRVLPLNGSLMKEADHQDQRLLARAAVSVVLQREISLSRRVYTWLLGSEETSEGQIAYFKRYSLDVLSEALKGDMERAGSHESIDSQKPFKIFLSLLDRWEIGSVLSERLAVPALQSLKNAIAIHPTSREEFILTASAVYDAVEPLIVWKAYFSLMQDKDADLMAWSLSNLPQKDEEVTTLHVPAMLDYVLNDKESSRNNLAVASILLQNISPSLLARDQSVPGPSSFLAVDMYAKPVDSIESLYHHASDESVPRAVKRIFDLAVDASLSIAESLTVLAMAERLIEVEAGAIGHLNGTLWLAALVGRMENVADFTLANRIVGTILKASRSNLFRPPLSIAQHDIISPILGALFRFLCPLHAAYHGAVVELLWEFNRLAEIHTLENVITRQISANVPKRTKEAMQAFGTLWRLTDDAMLPGEIFFVPMLRIIDSLKSKDPEIQGAAESWMRCNLKSYFRLLDPLIGRLTDPAAATGDVATRELDVSLKWYIIDNLGIVLENGGKELDVLCRSTDIRKSPHPILASKSQTVSGATYMDVMVSVLSSQLASKKAPTKVADRALMLRLQNSAVVVLQLLVSRAEVARASLDQLKLVLLAKIESTTRLGEITLQNRLLHLLHSVMIASPVNLTHRQSSSINEKIPQDSVDGFERALAHTIIDGVSSPNNREVLQHWIDFVLMVGPLLKSKPAILHSMCDCFSLQVRIGSLELKEQIVSGSVKGRGTSETDVVALLSGLDRLLSLTALAASGRKSEDGRVGNEGGSGIFGLVSGVFVADAVDEKTSPHNTDHIRNALEVLLIAWAVSSDDLPIVGRPALRPMERTRERTRDVLEKMFQTQTSLTIAGCIDIWSNAPEHVTESAVFDCIDNLTPSAQKVVEIISDAVTPRQGRPSNPRSAACMAFLEAYVTRLEAPIAVQIWATMFGFAREMLSAATTSMAKAQLYPLLRCLTVLCRTVSTTSALEDRRLRRELQDVYPKVLDAVVTNFGREASTPSLRTSDNNSDRVDDIQIFLAESVIPHLRSFLVDADRVTAACSVISLNTVSPALRQHRTNVDTLKLVLAMTMLPPAAKTWRAPVGDAFNDARFFSTDKEEVSLWKPLICALMDSDKERFLELLGRITAAPSANIFTNREQEMISRSANLRRLSFVLLAAEQNHYLTQLPAIQEKLVDILRTNVVSPRVHSEVYLCLRIIMCRISAQHLTNFWPVILAELLRVFEAIMDEPPSDGSESLQLALASCKFLDLLLVIQSEDFQIHQWMFVTDTTDAVYPSEYFTPEAIMDTLAEILREHSHNAKGSVEAISLETSDELRRPRLAHVKSITSLHQLEQFFSRASIDTFETVYASRDVDWSAIEEGFDGEIFG